MVVSDISVPSRLSYPRRDADFLRKRRAGIVSSVDVAELPVDLDEFTSVHTSYRLTSASKTVWPAVAATWAMPAPICPAPSTPIV
jgi:hypothetical protein